MKIFVFAFCLLLSACFVSCFNQATSTTPATRSGKLSGSSDGYEFKVNDKIKVIKRVWDNVDTYTVTLKIISNGKKPLSITVYLKEGDVKGKKIGRIGEFDVVAFEGHGVNLGFRRLGEDILNGVFGVVLVEQGVARVVNKNGQLGFEHFPS